MMPIPRSVLTSALLAGALATIPLAACDGGPGGGGRPAAEGIDTTRDEAMDGLSPEELQERAQAMPPEQAEALGIVDSTIHIPDPTLADTFVSPPGPPLQPPPRR